MDPYIGQVDILPYTFAPRDYSTCDGQTVPISQNQVLFAVIGSTYGGNGYSDMKLPDLKGRAPTMFGGGPGLTPGDLGDRCGIPEVALLKSELPAHSHEMNSGKTVKPGLVDQSNGIGLLSAARNNGGGVARVYLSEPSGSSIQLNAQAVSSSGANLEHENRQPYLALQFCICIDGLFPPRN